ncbi:MAG: Mrp/NBP35 family ATP-binding protein [Verrucomicrobia bacterium]|nr:Mrp/NBP35 family ATP-binding protein [Verrucomicrobiota bacterium]MBR6463889.1 Mrp/NBP35 family ATP-binding protein [Verrucomicrobiota bacterium]
MATVEDVRKALESVKYPGYSRSIISFNIVKDIRITETGTEVELQLTTDKEEVVTALRNGVERVVGEVTGKPVQVKITTPQGPAPGQAADPFAQKTSIPGVKNVIAIASGKGGVGKSTVAVNLACELARKGRKVGLLDCDIYGPSIPLMMGVKTQPGVDAEERLIPPVQYGVKLMSIGFLLDEGSPVIWRGPLIMKAIQQFLMYVVWGDLDYLLVDLPPGTGDAQLSLCQTVPLTGGVVVTTPQEASIGVVRRGIGMLEQVKVPVLGIVENMSGFTTPDGQCINIFGEGGGKAEAERRGYTFLGDVPLFVNIRVGGDQGVPVVVSSPESDAAKCFAGIVDKLIQKVEK